MKKGLIFFLIFAAATTFFLYESKNFGLEEGKDGTKILTTTEEKREVDLNDFLAQYQKGTFEKLELVDGMQLIGYQKLPQKISNYGKILDQKIVEQPYTLFQTKIPLETSFSELGIALTGTIPVTVLYNQEGYVGKIFSEQILPFFIIGFIVLLIFRFFGPKGAPGLPFGATAGKLKTKAEVKTRFSDIAGMEEVKAELAEIVDFLKSPERYKRVGARTPKGVLLYGTPGSGKTLLARAVAGEAHVPFFSASGSEFMEMLVGMGAAKVRELFTKAKTASPAIIFIDEIDAIGKRRGSGYTGGHQEQEQTLNQILTEMDGFDTDTNIIVIAATNRPDTLDPALLRAGRFDRKVMVGKPTMEERIMIIDYYLKNKKIADTVDLASLARRTSGMVGADIENLVNEAALKLAREGRSILETKDFDYALEKVVMGPEKKIKSIKEKERQIIALHELGHAVTAFHLQHADPVEKISIVSRGMALGVTRMMPQEDAYLISKAKFQDELVSLLGGRAAEETFFGKEYITTGASNDFEKVTRIATDMVVKYGMDDDIGTINYTQNDDMYSPTKPFSEKTGELIDKKVKDLISDAYKKAKTLIKKHQKHIQKMAEVLLEREYLTRDEFELYMKKPGELDKALKFLKAQSKTKIIEADALHLV